MADRNNNVEREREWRVISVRFFVPLAVWPVSVWLRPENKFCAVDSHFPRIIFSFPRRNTLFVWKFTHQLMMKVERAPMDTWIARSLDDMVDSWNLLHLLLLTTSFFLLLSRFSFSSIQQHCTLSFDTEMRWLLYLQMMMTAIKFTIAVKQQSWPHFNSRSAKRALGTIWLERFHSSSSSHSGLANMSCTTRFEFKWGDDFKNIPHKLHYVTTTTRGSSLIFCVSCSCSTVECNCNSDESCFNWLIRGLLN